ncbi:MBL fold metallo-hydrolase, partial [Patescibacteria group bacterium]|nr:MBL fold metallo-hydrolase [Patescibacteria group bacterium]
MQTKRLLKWIGISLAVFIIPVIIIVFNIAEKPIEAPQPTPVATSTTPLQVHFIDVGQGDSILIDSGTNEVLIDGGKKSPGVTDYISKYIDGPLEVMVATHTDVDHIGGLIKVLDVFQVEEI